MFSLRTLHSKRKVCRNFELLYNGVELTVIIPVADNTRSGSVIMNDTLIHAAGSSASLLDFFYGSIFYQFRVCRLEALVLVDVCLLLRSPRPIAYTSLTQLVIIQENTRSRCSRTFGQLSTIPACSFLFFVGGRTPPNSSLFKHGTPPGVSVPTIRRELILMRDRLIYLPALTRKRSRKHSFLHSTQQCQLGRPPVDMRAPRGGGPCL